MQFRLRPKGRIVQQIPGYYTLQHCSSDGALTSMKTLSAALLCTLAITCHAQAPMGENRELTQVSTINALIKGGLDGSVSFGELRKHGDFGIGTLDKLDGEMITLDGVTYQVNARGEIHPVPDSVTTPFASITKFAADETFPVSNVPNYAQLQDQLDSKLPSHNYFYAVKITGSFPQMKVRSVARQEKPYRPLTEIVKEQSVFDFPDTSGTLVGFRCPDFVQGVNVARYHMHFISADKTRGGHVLDFSVSDGEVAIDNLSNFRMMLPEDPAFMKMDLSDKGEEGINRVEKLMGDPAKDK